MERKLFVCLEQDYKDSQAQLNLCKQREAALIVWLTEQARITYAATAHATYYKVIHHLEEQHANTTSNI